MARCVNNQICEAYICVASPGQANAKCKSECGFYARVVSLSSSNCTASVGSPVTVYQLKSKDFEARTQEQERRKSEAPLWLPKEDK